MEKGTIMKRILLGALALLLTLGTASVALAEGPSITATVECGIGPVLYRFDIPRDENGDVNFISSMEIQPGLPGYKEPNLQPVGERICLKEGMPDIYLLRVGYGPDLQLPSKDAVIQVLTIIQHETNEAAARQLDMADATRDNS